MTHLLFDSGATHCFVIPYMVGNGYFQKEPRDHFWLVEVAGGQIMFAYGIIRHISVIIGEVKMPADLRICRFKSYDMILGMDWLEKYMAHLDCHRGRVLFENDEGSIVYQGIIPTPGSLVISAIQAGKMVEKGCEAYLARITTVEVGPYAELCDILAVSEFEDVFRALTGFPTTRSVPFTIELEPGTALISKAPYPISPAEKAELKK